MDVETKSILTDHHSLDPLVPRLVSISYTMTQLTKQLIEHHLRISILCELTVIRRRPRDGWQELSTVLG